MPNIINAIIAICFVYYLIKFLWYLYKIQKSPVGYWPMWYYRLRKSIDKYSGKTDELKTAKALEKEKKHATGIQIIKKPHTLTKSVCMLMKL